MLIWWFVKDILTDLIIELEEWRWKKSRRIAEEWCVEVSDNMSGPRCLIKLPRWQLGSRKMKIWRKMMGRDMIERCTWPFANYTFSSVVGIGTLLLPFTRLFTYFHPDPDRFFLQLFDPSSWSRVDWCRCCSPRALLEYDLVINCNGFVRLLQ